MNNLTVKEIELALQLMIRRRFAVEALDDAGVTTRFFDEDGHEVTAQSVQEAAQDSAASSIALGAGHAVQMRISGPPRESDVVDAEFDLIGTDWRMVAQAAGRKRGYEPDRYALHSMIITDAAQRFFQGVKAAA